MSYRIFGLCPLISAIALLTITMPAHADNIAACEIVLLESVEDGASMASFRPAVDFLTSVYDDEDGHMTEMDGLPIRAILCARPNVIPTLRDFPIVATGLPFSLSENFDSPDSRLLTVQYVDDAFKNSYKGRDMTPDETTALDDVMMVFNLQPHDLASKKAKKVKKKKSDTEKVESKKETKE